MAVLFYALFDSGISKHDRISSFSENKNYSEFIEWIQEKRIEIEKLMSKTVIVLNMKYLNDENAENGPYQLCPKCDGEGQVPNIGTSSSTHRTCPVCNGSKLLVRPGVKNESI